MNDKLLEEQATIVAHLYNLTERPRPLLGLECWLRHGVATEPVQKLVAAGVIGQKDDGAWHLADTALKAMEIGVLAAARCVVSTGARSIADLAAENARLKDLVRHVQSQPDRLRSCRCELMDNVLIITMPAGDERTMVERIVEWGAEKGAYIGQQGKRLRLAEQAALHMAFAATEFKSTLEWIASEPTADARRSAVETLEGAAEYPAIIKMMAVLYHQYIATLHPAWSAEITLGDCTAWAEAIVVALETSEDWILEEVYEDALCCWRALARGASATGMLLDTQRLQARAEAKSGRYDIARVYAAIIAVRTLADEAIRRQA